MRPSTRASVAATSSMPATRCPPKVSPSNTSPGATALTGMTNRCLAGRARDAAQCRRGRGAGEERRGAMTDAQGTPSILSAELSEVLAALETLLRDHGVHHWAEWVARDRGRLAAGDASVTDHLLSAYGGAGSLNDLWICPENGHRIAPDAVEAVNARLARLRAEAFRLAQALAGAPPA